MLGLQKGKDFASADVPAKSGAAQNKARLHFLDLLRGLAAISVVISHYVSNLDDKHLLHGGEAIFAAILDRIDPGKFGVALFFLISGYIIPNSLGASGDRIGRFCITRFFRLYPLYWVALAVAVALPWPDLNRSFPLPVILTNLTMIQGYLGKPDVAGAFWTLEIELTFYFFCLVAAYFRQLASPRSCAGISIGFLAIALLMAIARGVLLKKLPVALPLAMSLMFFGTVWRQAYLGGVAQARRLAPWLLGTVALTIVPISLIGYNHDFGFHENWQTYVICYLLALLTFTVLTTRLRLSWRPLVFLGEVSYSLYLLASHVASAVEKAGFTAEASGMDPLIYAVLVAILAVFVAWLAYKLIEQPFVRLGHHAARRFEASRLGGRLAVALSSP